MIISRTPRLIYKKVKADKNVREYTILKEEQHNEEIKTCGVIAGSYRVVINIADRLYDRTQYV